MKSKKTDNCVVVNPKSLIAPKVDLITFKLKNAKVVNIDKALKRIYSITN